MRRFLPLMLLALAVAFWNSGCGDDHHLPSGEDYWVDMPGGSFWGFVSNDGVENLSDPVRPNDLDPVNVIFWVDGTGSALQGAITALQNKGWTLNDPCWELPWPLSSFWPSTLFAYFQPSPSRAQDADLHYVLNGKADAGGCQDKYHIRLFQPKEGSPWAIGAVHRDWCDLDPISGEPGPISGCWWPHKILSWEDPETDLWQALEGGGVPEEVCLGNTDVHTGMWREKLNDGEAAVVRLSPLGTAAGAGDKIDVVIHSLGCSVAP